MLNTIQKMIQNEISDDTPFDLYYQKYVMKIQDSNIDAEVSYMLHNNIVSVELVDRAVLDMVRRSLHGDN